MIGLLRGCVIQRQPPQLLIDVNGVGYEVEAPMSTFYDLPADGAEVTLHIHMVVREDAQILYGFATDDERLLFRTLLKVNRVGAKMALGVLSAMSASDFRRCVEYEDAATLVKIPGVGKKTAERLIIEMRDKIDTTTTAPGVTRVAVEASPRSEAVDALLALGYKSGEVNKLLGTMDIGDKSAEDIIRSALQQAAQ